MRKIQYVIVIFFCVSILFSCLSFYGFIEGIPIYDTASSDLVNNFFLFKVVIFTFGIFYFLFKKNLTNSYLIFVTTRAKFAIFSFFVFSFFNWSVLFIKYFLPGFPLSLFDKNIYDNMGLLLIVYNISSIGCLFFIFSYISLNRVNIWLGFLLFFLCALFSFKLSRIALISNISTFFFLWVYFQKLSNWFKFLIILISLSFIISFNINDFINLRSEVTTNRSAKVQLSPASIIDLYLGSPRYQAKLGEVNYTFNEILNSVIAPIPIIFRKYSNSHVNSVDLFNYSIYSNYIVKDQVPMFYFDLFRVFGFPLSFIIWMYYIFILHKFSSSINHWNVYLTFKMLFFSIFSFEGISITILNDILPFFVLHFLFTRKKIIKNYNQTILS